MNFIQTIEGWITRERIRILCILIVPALLLFDLIQIWSNAAMFGRFPYGHDFVAFWSAARLAVEGQPGAVYEPSIYFAMQEELILRGGVLPWFYPPTFLAALMPLGFFGFPAAWVIFSGVGIGGLALAARPFLKGQDRIGWALLLGAPVMGLTLVQGQNGAIVAALMLGAFAARAAGRTWLAAVLIAALTIKPHLAILIPVALLAARDWRLIWRAGLVTLIFLAAPCAVFGTQSWTLAFQHLSKTGWIFAERETLVQMVTIYAGGRLMGLPAEFATALQVVSAGLAVIFVWRLWRDPRVPGELKLAGLLMAALLVPPYGFRYDMVVTLAATLLIAGQAQRQGWMPGERLCLAALWLLPLVLPNIADASNLPAGFALLLLGLWSVRRRVSDLP
ncbi:glycosyltransferase family 87 protein [Defluviimonas sp. WL0075]|uniref:DUF2029 domain-containing protein n=1 Tax=Albidovulum sediminicola TaxID=2984331 RepID=A0ABT2Z3X4_9RHOB|nr:glycosyltransferase family 87 protein [Defluviimonas sp. WL0075]MCV2865471.1 DUF2029 domain-containing protein [Defluviimonas sp. WL0075]